MTFYKDPNDVRDYTFNWVDELEGDTISTSTWFVPSGITRDSDSKTNTATAIWLSGGTDGVNYEITNRIVTAGGRTLDRTATFIVRNR